MGYIVNAFWHSLVCFAAVMLAFRGTTGWQDGRSADFYLMGCLVYCLVVIVVNLKLALETRSFTLANIIILVASIGSFFLFIFLVQYALQWSHTTMFYPMTSIANDLFSNLATPLVIALVVVVCLGRDLGWAFMRAELWPTELHKARKQIKHQRRRQGLPDDTEIRPLVVAPRDTHCCVQTCRRFIPAAAGNIAPLTIARSLCRHGRRL